MRQFPPDSLIPSLTAVRRALSLALALLAACASAQGPAAGALDDWGGARSALARSGLRLEAIYTGETVRNFSGGQRKGAVYLGEIDFKATLDGARVLGVPGLTAFMHVLRTHGGDPDALVGDAQGESNIAASAGWRLFEAWLQQDLRELRTSLLAGRFDVNAEFYHLDSADLFLNSSFGIGPEFSQTGRGGPSIFPESALGARLELRPAPFVLRAAVLNGVPASVPREDGATGLHRGGDGLLYVVEAGLVLPLAPASTDRTRPRRLRVGRAALAVERDTKASVGWWHYTGWFDDLARMDASGEPVRQRGSSGAYVVAEQVVYRHPSSPSRRLRLFAQLGTGDERTGRFGKYAGGGATLIGPFASRSEDEAGIAYAQARSSAAFRENASLAGEVSRDAETVLELTYLIALRSWLSVQPSLQHVRHPGGAPGLKDATVGLLRFEIYF